MGLRVLHPAGETVDGAVGDLRAQIAVPSERPYVVANFVATVDGSVALQGGSTPIARHAPGDRPLLKLLREQADAVLAGAPTLAREQYRPLVGDADARARRVSGGLSPRPLAVVLSRSGRIPDGVPLLEASDQRVRAFTGADADPVSAFAALRASGVELLVCEGGPTLLGDLLRRDLVDELFVTFAPVLGSGEPEHTLFSGTPDRPRPLRLVALLEQGGGLHARYAIDRS